MTRMIVVVFDGLNEELVTEELMPNLLAFAGEGARLANHRPVFPSVTRLNAAAMVTGCFPGTHGLPANLSLVPEFHPTEPMDALEPQLTELRKRTGEVLFVPTLAEMLAEHGLEYIAAGVGTSGQAFLHHPNGEDATSSATIHTDFTLPRPLYLELVERFGVWPPKVLPNSARLQHLTTLFTEYVIAERDPAVALLWFSEPDSSQHGAGLGSPTVQQAVRDADAEFGRLLAWLRETGRGETNVIVTCDHGQATIGDPIDLRIELTAAGFAAPGEPGGVIVAPNGGSALFYVDGHDAEVADRLAAWLMAQPWSGPILASSAVGPIEGTLPSALLGIDGRRGPDLALSFTWSADANEHGAPGRVYSGGGTTGRGTHGSMSPWEFRTFTVARGPAFRAGMRIEAATTHPDLAPTILAALDLPVPSHIEGRVIHEVLADGASVAGSLPRTGTDALEEHRATRDFGEFLYEQVLRVAPRDTAVGVLVAAEARRLAIVGS